MSKIKVESNIPPWKGALKWDIKHLELKDDDVIHAAWVDDDNFDYRYWLAT
jgi:hypothetical protein